jgi:hypothetical protein
MTPIQSLIDTLEKFILSNEADKTEFCQINSHDLDYADDVYNRFKTINETVYEIFGSNGYTSYGLFKSSNKNIYIIKVFVQELIAYKQYEPYTTINKNDLIITDV